MGVTCYQFDYKKEVSKEISLYDIPGRIIGADETDFIIIVGSIIRQLCIGIILKQEKMRFS